MTTSTTSSSGNILSNEETSTIEERILTLQRAIHKLTRDSWQHHHAVITPSENPDIDRNDPTASFHLGMELFGQEVSLVEEAVREKLTNLERELLVVRDELLSSTTGTTMGEERDKKTDLNTGMSAEGRGPTRRSRAELSSEIEQLEIKIRFLRECSTIRTILDDVATALRSHDPQRAVQGVLDAEHAVTRARGVIQHQSIMASRETLAAAQRIVESVAMDVRREKVHLVHMALKGWNDNVILTSDTLSVRREEDLALCFDLLGSLQPSIVLHDTIRKFVLDLYQTVLEPVLTRHSKGRDTVVYPLSIQKVQDKETGMPKPLGYSSSSSNAWRLEWSRTADETEKTTNDQSGLSLIMAWKDTFAFLRQIILFSAEHILLNRAPLCKLMGEILFGKPKAVPHVSATFEALGMDRASRLFDGDDGILYEKLLETLEETCIPISLERDEWKQLGELSRDLDEFMAPFWNDLESKRIWSDTNSKLAAFTTLLEEQYIERRRCMLLNQARSLIVKSDYHNTVEVGEEVRQGSEEERLGLKDGMTVFLLHKSSISESAFNLLELVRVTMNEAVEQHVTQTLTTQERLSPALYRTARDMLDMFRAIIPIKYGHEISQMPRTAAILHNDCVYLAHHCLTLGLEYRDKFGKETLLGQMCIFVDMVPLFRDLAERSMGDTLNLQASKLVELVGDRVSMLGMSLSSNETVSEWSEAEHAIAAGLYHLRHLSETWSLVLSSEILNRSMGFLADVLFKLLLDQITSAKDISTISGQFVCGQLEKVIASTANMIPDKSCCRHWERLVAVARFMDMNLKDIEVALTGGVFCSISAAELSSLVTASFSDSPNRRSLLKLLDQSQLRQTL